MTEPATAIDATLAALADPVRRRVIELLADRPRRPGELAADTATSASTLSKHLKVLRTSGLVTETHPDHDARVRIYTLRAAPMTELRDWLATTERGWAEQLSAFADFIAEEQP